MENIPSPTIETRERIRTANDLKKIIESAPKISDRDTSQAPFANYTENTHKIWDYVSPEVVDTYLKEKFFFNTSHIPYDSKDEIGEVFLDEPLNIPLDLVVSAAGFADCRGRNSGEKTWNIKSGQTNLYGAMKSQDVIKLYAGTPSVIPPVSNMQMFIQPDGKVFFDNGGGDSHRIAAAILRGEKEIGVKSVIVYRLDEDYI